MNDLTNKGLWQQLWPHILVVLLFLLLSVAYFFPKLQGMELQQGDTEKYQGVTKEISDYYTQEGASSAWTGSLFSGMPTYQIGVLGGLPNVVTYLEKPLRWLGALDMGVVFASLLSFYLIMILLGVPIPLAILSAIGYSFSCYSIIILEAGHITKAWSMAYLPLVVGGLLLVLKDQKYRWGGLLFAIGLTLQIRSNHLQITYYLAILCLIIAIGYVISMLSNRQIKELLRGGTVLLVAALLAALANISNLYSNYEMSHESIRGQSELSAAIDGKQDKSTGLDKEYAFAWSYGKGELLTLLIPNAYGGASGGALDAESHLYKELKKQGYQADEPLRTYTYWGDQPFTSGPVYLGAIICFLFILSLFVVKGPLKWSLLVATVFFILLSFGYNLDGFNDWMFHNLPMYNKFRTVSMALVIPQFTFALLAAMALATLIKADRDPRIMRKMVVNSAVITGGVCLILAVLPSMFLSFSALADGSYGLPDWYINALRLDREALLVGDAWRSLLLIVLSAAAIWFSLSGRTASRWHSYLPYLLALMVLIDLWSVDKRYLNEASFVSPSHSVYTRKASVADKIILADKDPSYRVLNLNNTFQDAQTSYFHKSIGGYHAAKLRRYQELIDMRIIPEISSITAAFQTATQLEDIQSKFAQTPVLNMLNMRYMIYAPEQPPIVNPYAYGNGWFVKSIQLVDNADQEISALAQIDPHSVALVDKRFTQRLQSATVSTDSLASITMTQYKPDHVSYQSHCADGGVALFSEVYYEKGWKAYIDGQLVDHIRANWILRALQIPAGDHQIEFKFIPDHYITTRWVEFFVSSILLLWLLIALLISMVSYKKR